METQIGILIDVSTKTSCVTYHIELDSKAIEDFAYFDVKSISTFEIVNLTQRFCKFNRKMS